MTALAVLFALELPLAVLFGRWLKRRSSLYPRPEDTRCR